MTSAEILYEIPDNHTIDFIAPEVIGDPSYFFRKIYIPAALIRLSKGEHFIGEGSVHTTGRGMAGYYEARDYYHSAPEFDQTLKSLQGNPDEVSIVAEAFGLRTTRPLPNIAQVVGLQLDPETLRKHRYGKYYTVDSSDVPVTAVDQHSRLGLFKLLGEPTVLGWFVEDIDPDVELELRLHHIRG